MPEPYFTHGYRGGNVPLVMIIDETEDTDREEVL